MKRYFNAFVLMLVVYGMLFFGILSSQYKKMSIEPIAPFQPYVAFGIETDSSAYIPFEKIEDE
jgi:preprotein translocase subunit Sec63